MNEPVIYDPDFRTGDTALFCYGLEDNTAIVQVLAKVLVHGEEWYAVSAHEELIKILDVKPSTHYTRFYRNELQDQHKVFIVEPDELEYPTRTFIVIEGKTPEEK